MGWLDDELSKIKQPSKTSWLDNEIKKTNKKPSAMNMLSNVFEPKKQNTFGQPTPQEAQMQTDKAKLDQFYKTRDVGDAMRGFVPKEFENNVAYQNQLLKNMDTASSVFTRRYTDSATIGTYDATRKDEVNNSRNLSSLITGPTFQEKLYAAEQEAAKNHPVANFLGTTLGYLTPGSLAAKGASTLLKPVLKGVGKLATRAIEGAVGGGAMELAEGNIRGESASDIAKRTALGAGIGAIADPLLGALGDVITNKLKKNIPLTLEEIKIVQSNSKILNNVNKEPWEMTKLEYENTKSKEANIDQLLMQNNVSSSKVNNYINMLKNNNPEPISVLDDVVTADMIGDKYYNGNNIEQEITANMVGKKVYIIEDGNHRFVAAKNTGKKTIPIDNKTTHKYYINKAIKEGKAISKEILQEYPDLMQKIVQANTGKIDNLSQSTTPNNLTPSKVNTLNNNTSGLNGTQSLEMPQPINRVVMESKKPKLGFIDTLNKYYTRTVDTQRPISRFSKQAQDQTYTLSKNSRNAGNTVGHMFEESLVDRAGNKIGASLKEVAEKIPKGKEQVFWDYMAQRHNIDRAREGKAVIPNYTPEMSQQAAMMAEKNNPELKAAGDEIISWLDTFMKEWGVNAGTVDKDMYEQLRQTYKSYFPTQREFSQLEKSMPDNVRSQFVDASSPIKKAKESEKDINNPLENIMSLVNRTVKTAKYNEVGQSLLDSVRKQSDKLKEFAEIIAEPKNLDNVVSVMENGKPVYLQINNKEFLDSMKGLPKVANNAQLMRKISGVFKGLITQKNPLFAIRNVFRDVPTAYIYGSENNPLKFAKNLASATKDITTNSENFKRYKALGGGGSNFFSANNVEQTAKELTSNKFTFKKALSGIEKLNSLTETAPRLAEFNSVLEKTGDVQKALAAANDVTVNFSRGGDLTKSLEPYVPYFNAGVQGIDKFFRSFTNPKTAIATLVKSGVAITAPQIALHLINKDNPNYQSLDNRTKDTYFLIPKSDGTFFKIPKSRELGVLFGSLFDRAIRQVSNEENAFKGFKKTLSTNFSPANPVENNLFSPLIYNIPSNKDFADRSIVPLGMKMDNRSKYLQFDEKTSEIAKAIGKLTANITGGEGLSPKQIDYVLKSYTGIIGQVGLPLLIKGGDSLKAVTGSFNADPLYSNKDMQSFYDNLDKYTKKATDRNINENLPSEALTQEEAIKNNLLKANNIMSDINKLSARVVSGNTTNEDNELIQQITTVKPMSKDELVRYLKSKALEIAKQANQGYEF